MGTVKKVTDILSQIGVDFAIYDEVKQNPTVTNVNKGLEILKSENCDFAITIGGGSPQDCGKAISILATNGGDIRDYEGINKIIRECLKIFFILLLVLSYD